MTSVGGKAAKTAAEEVVNIGTGMVSQVVGKKKKSDDGGDLDVMRKKSEQEDRERVKMWRKKLLAHRAQESRLRRSQLPLGEERMELPKPALQLSRVEPHLLAKPKRPRGLPTVGKDWAEKRSGWGTSGG